MHNEPVHRSIIAIDIEKFGRTDRTDSVLVELRRRLDELLVSALTARLDRGRMDLEDTGDGKLCLIDTEHVVRVLDAVDDLDKLVADYNRVLANERTRLRLRVVVHAGPVIRDDSGWSGHAVIVAFRLLDSQQLRERLAASSGDLVLGVSEQIYEQVISQGHWVRYPAARFERVVVRNKETRVPAWVLRPAPAPSPATVGAPPAAAERAGSRDAGARPPVVLERLRGAAVAVARWIGGLRPSVLAVGAFLLVVAIVAAVALVVAETPGEGRRRGLAAEGCPVPVVLPVLTSPTMVSTMRSLAAMFDDGRRTPCRSGSVQAFPAPSSSEAVNLVAADWTRDALGQLGPRPAVLLLDSSIELERINAKLGRGGRKLAPLGPIATAPVVLALPSAVRARLRLGRTVPWSTILRWGRRSADDPQALRIVRADPTSSTAALLATVGLYGSGVDPHGVELALGRAVGDETTELCDRRQLTGAGGGPPHAVLVSEQAVISYNHGALGGACGTSRPSEAERLEAIYPADGTPVLDYSYVPLPAASELPARERLARDFYTFLRSAPALQALRRAGFRDQRVRVAPTIGEQDGIVPVPPNPMALPSGPAVAKSLDAWEHARQAVTALLAIDVSGSMRESFEGPGGSRISAARSAAKRAVKLMSARDRIGLLRFSTRLSGPRDYQQLVPIGPADGPLAGRRRRDLVQRRLDGLQATHGDTGLYDTMLAGIQGLRSASAGQQDAVRALIVVTDGQNDDPTGGAGVDQVLSQLDAGDQVQAFLLTFGPVKCDTGELRELDDHPDVRCVDANGLGVDGAFDQVSAALWGTSRAGATQ